MRRLIRFLTDWYSRRVVITYGDVATLHSGPCERCVGMTVTSPSVTVQE